MTAFSPRKSVYLDTNALIYSGFWLRRPPTAPDLDYYRVGDYVVRALNHCQEHGFRVFSTDLAYLEMHYNYHQWARLRQALELGAPPGLIFGGPRMDREFLEQPLSAEAQQEVLEATQNWLSEWDFSALIQFVSPEEMPTWFGIARCIYAHYMETVLDCLHLAAAIALECDYFLTQDQNLRRLIADMRSDPGFREALLKENGVSADYGLPDACKAQSFVEPR